MVIVRMNICSDLNISLFLQNDATYLLMTELKSSAHTYTSRFLPSGGGISEYHSVIRVTDADLSFEDQLAAVLAALAECTAGRSVIFRRFFLSDPANQSARLTDALGVLSPAVTSIIGQPPLDGTKLAVWVYCTDGPAPMDGVWSHNGYTHVWNGHMLSDKVGSEEQMSDLFKRYDDSLGVNGLSVSMDCLRTWIFVRDVDTNYAGVVKGRKDYFNGVGLTPDTHFIASTGIGGSNAAPGHSVNMDACAVGGLAPGQIKYLHAYDHLSPTAVYGVTFERGTAVTYGDRRHVFISGTASIDSSGRVVHEGDPVRQTQRMLENVGALLTEADAGFGDIACSIVYLRDFADFRKVQSVISRMYPELSPLYVLAPVCRPAWLVEMECLAVVPAASSYARF